MSTVNEQPPIIKLNDPILNKQGAELFVCKLYLTHPTISGNKWFKLKYNLQEAKRLGLNTILTFGGAYSNHIHATAAACKEYGLKSIGIIRGERSNPLNSTLTFAESCGMQLYFIDRGVYRNKNTDAFIEKLKTEFGAFYLVPEGGSNLLGVTGCVEIMGNVKAARDEGQRTIEDFNYVCCACGTGATLAGITLSLKPHQKALGFSVLKGGEFLKEGVQLFIDEYNKNTPRLSGLIPSTSEYGIETNYHFGGYAKVTPQLFEFASNFEKQHNIPLDYVYTSKMFFGLFDLIKKGYFNKGSRIIAIHTGGLQGNKGFQK
ncbi:MAG: 1-aminocyclopropane-1-carboxylate deaminase/D-cysteine desulfhydrase [Bacteroidetes bacterium]|nr:1-aminocyclopropane-1-carboxylate deaminase/D-cysteine desulfhydrase [Bacteroidota bacterium]